MWVGGEQAGWGMKKTRAIEILSDLGCAFELGEFEATEFTAEEVAEKLQIPLEQVFKTLIVEGDAEPVLAVVPGDRELSLKKLAAAVGAKRMELVKLNDIQRLTGYLKGGVSPLGSKRTMPVLIDETAILYDQISVSAGLRGLQLLIAPEVLRSAAKARFVDLAAD